MPTTTRRRRPPLDLDTMAAIAEEAGRAATAGRTDLSPFDASPTLRDLIREAPRARRVTTAADLYRAAYDGALDPATD